MHPYLATKIETFDTIDRTVHRWKFQEEKVVFTNGCFDILHYGHIHYLMEAKELGNKLIIGLNSDASVRRLKGSSRPINTEKTRSSLLAALWCVDAVVVFEEDTPFQLIQQVIPDVLVKGGDWQPHQIVGADIVLKNGGTVRSLAFQEGYSTTLIEQKIRG